MRREDLGSKQRYITMPLRSAVDFASREVPWLRQIRLARQLRRKMRSTLTYEPNLKRPRTFNERIAWKILHDRNPLIPLTLDKVAVRDWVAEKIGEQYLVPILGVWHRPEDIPWNELPSRFVAKTNHGSGYNFLVPNKAEVSQEEVVRKLSQWLNECYYECTGEWGYRGIPRRVLVEEFLSGNTSSIPEDYKIYVFGGRPRLLKVHVGRFTDRWRSFFHDPKTLRPVKLGPLRHEDHPDYLGPPPEAAALYDLAATLGAGFDAVRVDFYVVGGRPVFSEMTHYSGGGTVSLGSYEDDRIMGDMWADALQSLGRPMSRYDQWLKGPKSAAV